MRRLTARDGRVRAKDEMKRKLLLEFTAKAIPGERFYKRFYGIVKKINEAFGGT